MTDEPKTVTICSVTSYDVFLDITRGDQTFLSRAEIHFRYSAPGDLSFADLRAVSVRQATLNGEAVDVSACTELPIQLRAAAVCTPRRIAAGQPACTAASMFRACERRSPSRSAPRPDGNV